MKRTIIVFAMLFFTAATVFADSAQVLAKDVLQATVAVDYRTAGSKFDADGGKADLYGGGVESVSAMNLGAAFGFGLMDGVNIELEWIPGVNVWSKYNSTTTLFDLMYGKDPRRNGVFDLFLGAKLQLLGDHGIVGRNKTLRLAFTPGFIIAVPGPDYETQIDKALDGEPHTIEDVDRHAMGVVARLSFDYILSPEFYINLFGEYAPLFETKKTGYSSPSTERTYAYGYSCALELEPRYSKKIAGGKILNVSLPLTYTAAPEVVVDGSGQGDASCLLALAPRVGIVLNTSSSPVELELRYSTPLLGKNVEATNSVSFLMKVRTRL